MKEKRGFGHRYNNMNMKTMVTFFVITLGILLGVGGLLWQFGENANKPNLEAAGEMRHRKGEGKIVVVEFSDFQCPACAAVHEPLKQVLAKYSDKVSFVYRHFPLTSIHKNAMLAAQASEAAHNQGKFWEYGDKLFAYQSVWSTLEDPSEVFVTYAKELELDLEKFKNDLVSQETIDVVRTDMLDATRFQLSGTPTLFVDGVKTDFAKLESIIQNSN